MGGRVCLWNVRGVVLIVEARSGVFYWNQTGGSACVHSEMQGVLVPFNNDPPLGSPDLELERQLGAATRNVQYLTAEVADRVDAILASWPETACARVDRVRLRESNEAWIHVELDPEAHPGALLAGVGRCAGVLTWQNSD